MQLSTVVSDGLLALACLICAASLLSRARQATALQGASVALLLTALTALCGSLRYAGLDGLGELHRGLSQASGFIGLPLLGWSALQLARPAPRAHPHWGILLAGLLALFLLSRGSALGAPLGLLLNLSGLALLLLAGARRWPERAALAAATGVSLLFLLAGLWVGGDGWLGPLRRVDLFHGLLTLAYPLLTWLLLRLARAQAAAAKAL